MDNSKGYDLEYQVEATEGSLLAEVINWLNKMSVSERNEAISQLLVMTCLPLAKADLGAGQAELERSYLECHQWLEQYKCIVKQRLNIQGESEQTTMKSKQKDNFIVFIEQLLKRSGF